MTRQPPYITGWKRIEEEHRQSHQDGAHIEERYAFTLRNGKDIPLTIRCFRKDYEETFYDVRNPDGSYTDGELAGLAHECIEKMK